MKRPFALVLLCAAWVVAALAAPALGQQGSESATELWEKFPLEPTATPASDAAQAPPPREIRVRQEGGTDTTVLIALLIASAGLGGLTIPLASRLQRQRQQATGVSTPVETAVTGPTTPPTRPAPAPPHAAARAKHAKPRRARAKAAIGSRVVHSRSSGGVRAPAPQPPQPPKRATPAPSRAPQRPQPSKPEPATPGQRQPSRPPEPARAKRETPARLEPSRPTEPARAKRETPARLEPSQPTEQPPPAHVAPPRGAVPIDAQAERETCWIELHSGLTKTQFHAVRYEGGTALARSPSFRVKRRDGEPGLDAPAALRTLVQQLAAAGWVQTSAGPAPWDLRFERERLPRPQARRRTR